MNKATATLLLLATSALQSSCGSQSKACTLIGCTDQLTVEVSSSGGATPVFAADLMVDGRSISCPAPAQGAIVTCDASVSIRSYEQHSCTQSVSGNTASQTCLGTGVFGERIVIAGAPALVSVALRNDSSVVAQQTFQPSYAQSQPNGPGCDPICRQASVALAVP